MRMSDLIDREALLRQIDIDSEGEPGYYGDTWKFIDTIKSMPPAQLSTNLTEVGTDCISRQAAIETFKDCAVNGVGIDGIVDALKQLPPAEPKRGKWIRTGSGSLYDHYGCSECGKAPKWDCLGDNRWKIAFTDFCPNCGAKMEVNNEID